MKVWLRFLLLCPVVMEELLKDLEAVLGMGGAAVWLREPNAVLGGRPPETVPLAEPQPLVGALMDDAYL